MDARHGTFVLLLAVLGVLVALVVRPFFTYVVGAGLLAFVLYPAHRRLGPAVGQRPSAALLVLGAVVAVVLPVVAMLAVVASEAAALAETVGAAPRLGAVETAIRQATGANVDLEPRLRALVERVADAVAGQGPELVSAGVHFFVGVTLLVFLLYYLLVDGDEFVAWLADVAPLSDPVRGELREEVERTTWAVLKGHVFVAVAQGVLAGVGLFVAGIPNAAFWTLVMVFLGFLPIVGVPLVWAPAAVYLVATGRVVAGALLALYGITLVAAVDDYLRAMLVDRGSSIHSGVILLGALGGVYALGAMGLFLGPILIGLFKAALEVFDEHYVAGA